MVSIFISNSRIASSRTKLFDFSFSAISLVSLSSSIGEAFEEEAYEFADEDAMGYFLLLLSFEFTVLFPFDNNISFLLKDFAIY